MKIAFVLDDSIDRPDGVQQYTLTIGAYLRELGHDVHYVCSEASRTDVTVHSLARNTKVTFNGNDLRIPLPTSSRQLREFLARERFDVIHVQMPHSPLFASRVVTQARRVQGDSVRIVGTFHILPDSRLSALGTRALGLLLRRNVQHFDQFCAVSAPAADFAHSTLGIDCEVIPNAVDITQFAQAVHTTRPERTNGDTLVIAFLGRLVPRKGALELLAALARLPAAVRNRLDVRIGGKGPLLAACQSLIDNYGLAKTVSLVGFVSEEDKPQFYADADVAVFPATGGESFGIVLIEAMAAGAGVVIGGDNPGYRSVLGDRPEVIVNARSPQKLANAIAALVDNPALRADLHREQAERVQEFDVAVVGARLMEFYGHTTPAR